MNIFSLSIQRDGDDYRQPWHFKDLRQLRSAIVHCLDFNADVRTIESPSQWTHSTAEQLRNWLAFEYLCDDP